MLSPKTRSEEKDLMYEVRLVSVLRAFLSFFTTNALYICLQHACMASDILLVQACQTC